MKTIISRCPLRGTGIRQSNRDTAPFNFPVNTSVTHIIKLL
jgi:hypothetical protein